jgi:hypothetical protein
MFVGEAMSLTLPFQMEQRIIYIFIGYRGGHGKCISALCAADVKLKL